MALFLASLRGVKPVEKIKKTFGNFLVDRDWVCTFDRTLKFRPQNLIAYDTRHGVARSHGFCCHHPSNRLWSEMRISLVFASGTSRISTRSRHKAAQGLLFQILWGYGQQILKITDVAGD
jgi:hypothetical protein